MADAKHLRILRKGIKVWNQWRKENPDIKPNLRRANLKHANLRRANLADSNLRRANLRRANLKHADLRRANLKRANLKHANLHRTNLYRAYIRRANLKRANLKHANLKRVQTLSTNFEGAILTGACIEDWNINSQTNLQNVKCDFIYLKLIYFKAKKKVAFRDRIPHDPKKIFEPGEYTKRYQKILETVNLYFGEGIDWQVFLNSFQKLQEEEKLKVKDGNRQLPIVQGIENTGDGSFVIKVGVSPDTDKGKWEESWWQKYKPMLAEKDEQIKVLREDKNELLEIIKLRASQQININNNFNNQQGDNNMNDDNRKTKIDKYFKTDKAGIVYSEGDIKDNAKVAAVINEAAQQDLTQATAEIQQLLKQLSKTNPTETPAEKMMVGVKVAEEIEKDPTLKQRIINTLKAMTVGAFMEAIDHPLANVVCAGIEGYKEPK